MMSDPSKKTKMKDAGVQTVSQCSKGVQVDDNAGVKSTDREEDGVGLELLDQMFDQTQSGSEEQPGKDRKQQTSRGELQTDLPGNMSKKILVILTSCDKLGQTDKPTGWYLPELAHPYKVLTDAGFILESVSPKGGRAPVDPGSVDAFKDDAVCQWFQKDAKAQELVNNTKTPDQIKPGDYAAVLYPGGHGPMFDLATDVAVAAITSKVFENGGVVAAVCHGPAGLIPVKRSNGDPLVKGQKVTAFSNSEEDAVQLSALMPFPLETKLKDLGGTYTAAADWQQHVVVDGKLITGQNPASSTSLAEEMVKLLK